MTERRENIQELLDHARFLSAHHRDLLVMSALGDAITAALIEIADAIEGKQGSDKS